MRPEGPPFPGEGSFRGGKLLPAAGTALLAGTVALRVLRAAGHAESVWRFYGGVRGPFWTLLSLALFLGPYVAAGLAAGALWLPGDRAAVWGALGAGGAAFFVFEEGLIVLARAVNGHAAYVGAEPLCSLLVCAVAIAGILRAGGAGRPGRRPGRGPGRNS